MKLPKILKKKLLKRLKFLFWLSVGLFISLFFITTFSYLIFQKLNNDVIYPGIYVENINLGGKTQKEAKEMFSQKNQSIKDVNFTFTHDKNIVATISAENLGFGLNGELLSSQAFSIGRSKNIFSDVNLSLRAYINKLYLSPSYHYSQERLRTSLSNFIKINEREPIDALFEFKNGRVTAFRPSENGQKIDMDEVNRKIIEKGVLIFIEKTKTVEISIPIKILEPSITTEEVNNFGIRELLAEGRSFFAHSISGRIYNINLAAGRLNGVLVAPNQTFSFDKILGDVSLFTGYQQAYVIKEGRTVLGDGGGVCQVSTTLFRAILNSGLPIVERYQHSYRVGYYEQDSPPGFDATIYVPSVDLKFKNDTGNYILIQTYVDPVNLSLTFSLYGTKDAREVSIGKPVITNQVPPPPPTYQDDPNLPKGQIKQVDFEAWGAKVVFTREVKKNGKTIIFDRFVSNYQPWQAVYLRGTKE